VVGSLFFLTWRLGRNSDFFLVLPSSRARVGYMFPFLPTVLLNIFHVSSFFSSAGSQVAGSFLIDDVFFRQGRLPLDPLPKNFSRDWPLLL